MATNVSIIDYKYRGLVCGNSEPAVTLGERTTTTGHLWWKKVHKEFVWCIVSPVEVWSDCGNSVEIDEFWGIVQTYSLDEEHVARDMLKKMKGE